MTGDERTVDVFRVPPPGHTSVQKFPVPVNDDVGVFTTYIVVTIMSGSTSSPYPFEVKGKSTVPRVWEGNRSHGCNTGASPTQKG